MSDIKVESYRSFFEEVIATISAARIKAYKALNRHQIALNFDLGRLIVENQQKHGWGKSVVESLSKDIIKTFDGLKGYSPQNLWRMRQFYLEYQNDLDLLGISI